jgi:hypothetical protein
MWGCDIFDNTDGSGWAHLINDCPTDNYSCGWYVRLLQDSTFTRELQCTYQDLRATVFDTTYMFNIIDSIGDRVQYAQARHFQKWPILGISGPAPEVNPVATTYAAELDTLKAWITRRLVWLDANMPGLCTPIAGVTEAARPPALLVRVDPGSEQVRFTGPDMGEGVRTLVVHDMLGRALARLPVQAGPIDVAWTTPGSGAYIFALWDEHGMVRSGRWVMP